MAASLSGNKTISILHMKVTVYRLPKDPDVYEIQFASDITKQIFNYYKTYY